jgi:hypothetical protein
LLCQIPVFRGDRNQPNRQPPTNQPPSVPVVPLEERTLDYSKEPIMWDRDFRQELLDGLVELGCAVEGAFDGQPQDIEGCWHDGRFAVVQARPQVLAPAPPPAGAGAAGVRDAAAVPVAKR